MQHTAMLWLPQALRDAGVNVIELDGWKEAQGLYFWTQPQEGTIGDFDEPPKLFMVHHTAGSAATPVVRTSSGQWSKANCWAGVMRGGRLYAYGDGEPTVVFTSSGPARVSSGYGNWPTALRVMNDERVPYDQMDPDGPYALNRYAWNIEVVHPGDMSEINEGVEDIVIRMGVLLAQHFGWSPWRTIGHLTWSGRKIDPRWISVDRIVYIQDRIAEIMEEEMAAYNKEIYRGHALGWFDSLTDEEFDLMEEHELFDGTTTWWKTLRDKGDGRTEAEDGYCIHFRNTNEIMGWANTAGTNKAPV